MVISKLWLNRSPFCSGADGARQKTQRSALNVLTRRGLSGLALCRAYAASINSDVCQKTWPRVELPSVTAPDPGS
jgi:hypothetical protein